MIHSYSRDAKPHPTIVRLGSVEIGGPAVVVMAGPCTIESRDQLLATARHLASQGVPILRGGAFKPRSSPHAFQGLGEEGLRLLADARAETGLKIVTEVMTAEKVDLVARTADILQVGARNMQNYDLLRACATAGKPVLLKRGLCATIDEWLQAAEYILAGNPDVILCERGIRTFETATRNTLDLSAIPVLRERTHLPIIVDPSHATGARRYVPPMAKAAVAAGADGLLLEVHHRPDEALCDGPQSLTHEMLDALLRDLASPFVRSLALSRVAFQGEHGAFSEQAARAELGAIPTLPCRDFRAVFDAVEGGIASIGIVPVENTLGGSVPAVYDLLAERALHVVGETRMRVVQNLIAHPGVPLSEIRRIYAHPQAAAQCERFLAAHPQWTLYQVSDTAGSVRMIREEELRDAAAIAGVAAADGMAILRAGIESNPENYTRFLLLARRAATATSRLITFTGPLSSLAALSVRRIESRPIPGRPWEYRFFADVEGDLSSLPAGARVL